MINISFEGVEEVNTVLGALGELPYRVSASLIDKIRNQTMIQLQPPQPVPTDEDASVSAD